MHASNPNCGFTGPVRETFHPRRDFIPALGMQHYWCDKRRAIGDFGVRVKMKMMDRENATGRRTQHDSAHRRRARSSAPVIALICLVACIACVPQIPAQTQTPDQSQDQNSSAIRVNSYLVMLDATVKKKNGEIMGNLKKEDFEVREDGVQQKIDLFSRDELPLNIAIVLDLSDSIGPYLGSLRDATTTALSTLKPDDQVALFTFSTDAQMLVALTKDKSSVGDRINSLRAGGATNINDGIFLAAQTFLATAPPGRRVIVLISDDVGTDAGDQGTNDIVTEAIAADTSLYNLKIPGYNPESTKLYAATVPGLVNIRKVAELTGGEIFDVPDDAHLTSVFDDLIQRIRTRYTLGYYTSANGARGKPHKLDVRLVPSFGNKGKDYVVLSRSSYYIGP
jgi:VWFA-related protein